MFAKDSIIMRNILRWKWVCAYTAFLLLSLGAVRRIVHWLRIRDLTGLISMALLVVGILGIVFVFRRVYRIQGRFTGSSLLKLLVFLAVYLFCVAGSTSVTEERVHFIQYGILGVLCFYAVDARYPILRRAVYAVLAAFTIGFLDEVIQGLLAVRYYDARDVAINGLAAGLPIAGLLWVPLVRRESLQEGLQSLPAAIPSNGPLRFRFVITDTTALLLVAGILCAMFWIGREKWEPGLLPGQWERENRCGSFERMRIQEDLWIFWEDENENRAQGRYQVDGNRLDGPQLRVEVLEGMGEGPCVWEAGKRRHYYFELDEQRLVFKKRRAFPFRRADP